MADDFLNSFSITTATLAAWPPPPKKRKMKKQNPPADGSGQTAVQAAKFNYLSNSPSVAPDNGDAKPSPESNTPAPQEIEKQTQQDAPIRGDAKSDTVVPDATIDDGLIDPATSERKTYRDRGVQREIWRPGDKDGDQTTDFFDRDGPPLPLESRWRLFQTDIGPITPKNQPPRFVMLDDRATWEVLKSEIPRAKLIAHWPHDFGGPGRIRARRQHRGRPAIKDPNAVGDARFQSTTIGKNDPYYFTGGKDFEPINYRYIPPKPEEPPKRKRKPERGDPDYNPRAHGHNQYTPKEMLVKHGAPSFSAKAKPEFENPRINRFVRREPSPEYAKDRTLYGGISENARASVARDKQIEMVAAKERQLQELRARRVQTGGEEEGEVVTQSSSGHPQRRAPPPAYHSDSEEEFPFTRPTAAPKQTTEEVLKAVEVPRNLGYVERRAFEQKLAARTIASVREQEDVTRISHELSQALVKVEQQAQEIDRLKQALEESQDVTDWQAEAESAQKHAAELEGALAAQENEINVLKEMLEMSKTKQPSED